MPSEMIERPIGGGNFTFQGTRIDRLGASEYTLVTILVDESGSVSMFADELRKMLVAAVDACKKSPRSENLLVRVLTFSSKYDRGVNEIHGFKPLAEIDTGGYPDLHPGGMTPLCDAAFSMVGAMNVYGKDLADQDYGVNGIGFIITDGCENASVSSMRDVQEEIKKSARQEIMESMVTILVGVNASGSARELNAFQQEAGMTHFVDAGDATPQRLAKLAAFVSRSVSSQSQALGTGGPSQNIAPTI